MNLGLKGKIALVTGGSHGIGLAIVEALRKEGCIVTSCSRREGCDVMYYEDIEEVMEQFSKLHILINNVGGGGRWGSEIVEETLEDVWVDVYTKNALSAIRFTMMAIPLMRKQKWGRVITIASIHGKEGGGRPWFNMAKAAEISLMKTLAMNPLLVRDGITFNSIAPGHIMIPDKKEKIDCDKFPLGRLGTPEEVASVVAFLCSEQASLINGACIAVDGGEGRSF